MNKPSRKTPNNRIIGGGEEGAASTDTLDLPGIAKIPLSRRARATGGPSAGNAAHHHLRQAPAAAATLLPAGQHPARFKSIPAKSKLSTSQARPCTGPVPTKNQKIP
ncbi:MAG: hypothetical protein MUC40_08700 [Akkermansiaceae bacterium]|jgi:hypothetical protein|nr:hypothetical protein [Akkermansiaceae bacterium]